MVIDLLSYVLPDEAWAQENHLAVAGTGGQPVYGLLQGKNFWEIKGSGGNPWDSFTFDENYIYQSITELDGATSGAPSSWTVPTMFKIFASKSWTAGNGGIVWMPRYMTLGGLTPTTVVTADSTYRSYTACSTFTQATLGGPVETHIEGPLEGRYAPNFGGSVGIPVSVIRQVYKWGPGYANMEVNYYAKITDADGDVISIGLVQWELWSLVNGVYVQKQVSAFNTIVAGGVPALNFPCAIPTI